MKTTDNSKQVFFDMQEHPERYAEQQIEAMMADIDQQPDVEAAWTEFEARQLGDSQANHHPRHLRLFRAAAVFVGMLVATYGLLVATNILSNPFSSNKVMLAVETTPPPHVQPAAMPDTSDAGPFIIEEQRPMLAKAVTSKDETPSQMLRVRGLGGSSGEPLIMVNGKPLPAGGLDALNTDDIDSIRVLKDSESVKPYMASYGERVRNGVVLITLKPDRERRYAWLDEASDAGAKVFSVVEVMPQFPGGQDSLKAFIASNVVCPEPVLREGVNGRVVISFVVQKDGLLRDFKAIRCMLKDSLGNACKDSVLIGLCETEALRVSRLMPRWKPGTMMGNPVDVKYNIPFRFNLPEPVPRQGGVRIR